MLIMEVHAKKVYRDSRENIPPQNNHIMRYILLIVMSNVNTLYYIKL